MRAPSAVAIAVVVVAAASGCGEAKRAPLRDLTEAVRVLERQGYTFPTLPGTPPGTQVRTTGSHCSQARPSSASIALTLCSFGATFNIHNGKPIAYLHKGGLYVMVVRGDSHTERVPGTLWYRSGNTILLGWLSKGSGPSGRAQFNALVEAL